MTLNLAKYYQNKTIKLGTHYRVYLKLNCLGIKDNIEHELYYCEDLDIPKLQYKNDEYVLGNIGIKIPYIDNESALTVKMSLVDDENASLEKLVLHGFLSDIFNFNNMVYYPPSRKTNLSSLNNSTSNDIAWIKVEIYDVDFKNITEEYYFYNILLTRV